MSKKVCVIVFSADEKRPFEFLSRFSLTRSQVVQQQLPTGEIKQMSGFSLQRHSLKQCKENRGENKLRPT